MAGAVSPCEPQAAGSGLHSAGKAALLQPKIHNVLGRMHPFFFFKDLLKKEISLPPQRLSTPRAWGEEPEELDSKSL